MTRTQRLTTVLALNLALVAGLVAVGVSAHSLGVLAEGGDYLLDAAGVGVAIVAIWLSVIPAKDTRRRAHPNATTIAALINAGGLLILELLVVGGAIDRLVTHTPHVAGLPVLIVSAVAAAVMVIGALVLRGDHASREPGDDDDDDLSIAAVLLDTVADAAAAAGVAVAGAIILATGGWYWLDPAVALLIAIVISWHAAALIRKALKQLPSRSQHEQADLASRAPGMIGRMIGRMHHMVLDCPDPAALAAFYSALLGLPVTYRDDNWVVVAASDTSSGLAFQRAPGNQPPTWPDPAVPQQFHLDIMVEDAADAGPRVLALGATKLDGKNVYADPAGHPFCLIRRPRWAPPIPDDA